MSKTSLGNFKVKKQWRPPTTYKGFMSLVEKYRAALEMPEEINGHDTQRFERCQLWYDRLQRTAQEYDRLVYFEKETDKREEKESKKRIKPAQSWPFPLSGSRP